MEIIKNTPVEKAFTCVDSAALCRKTLVRRGFVAAGQKPHFGWSNAYD